MAKIEGLKEYPKGEVPVKVYVHNDKDSNWDIAESKLDYGKPWGISEESARRFSYTALELTLDCVVDIKTGSAKLQAVNGVPLEREIEI